MKREFKGRPDLTEVEDGQAGTYSAKARAAVVDVLPAWFTLAFLTTAPYGIAALRTPDNHVFTWVLSAYDDTFTYLAWIKQSSERGLLLCNEFTSEQHQCEFFLPLWSLMGGLVRATGLPVPVAFHAGRLFGGLLLLLVARSVAISVLKPGARIRYLIWLYSFSAGLGWLVYLFNNMTSLTAAGNTSGSIDLDLPEAVAFRSVFAQVHLSIGAALTCLTIVLFVKSLARNRSRPALAAGSATSLLAVIHPYMVTVVAAVSVVIVILWPWLTLDKRNAFESHKAALRSALWFMMATLPGVSYVAYILISSAVARDFASGVNTLSPEPGEVVLGFGVVLAIAIPGFISLWRSGTEWARLPAIWFSVQALLLYAPVNFQRRLIEGIQLPLCVAATHTIFLAGSRLRGSVKGLRLRRILLAAFLIVSALTNVGFLLGHIITKPPAATVARRYVPPELAEALRWLDHNAEPGAVLISSYETGNLAPSMAGIRVYLGHYNNTIDSERKLKAIESFYTGQLLDMEVFVSPSVTAYGIYGPLERRAFPEFVPSDSMTPVRRFGNTTIYCLSACD